jgi:bacterioferritin (cytochrome b1)
MAEVNFNYMAKSPLSGKTAASQEKLVSQQKGNRDLQNLREAAKREISQAVYSYFTASREVLNELFTDGMTYQEYFAHEASDEMGHYLQLLRMVSKLDPTQKEQFIEHTLGAYLVQNQEPSFKFWLGPYCYPPQERELRWLNTFREVVKAISLELETINQYERYINEASNPEVKQLFAEILNHEKGDLADFNQMLFSLFNIK